ncbi:hypothetical protein [Flavobacteriaceae bacterium 14752]|uniref:hypothetical protein n=1 Tax=Mesohalobacter salilacus TaxID=2491711 RepID=UPI000F640D2D|nr:hypothetical protein EIG84_09895 [Flavobacteriaceae bacterium 14752]
MKSFKNTTFGLVLFFLFVFTSAVAQERYAKTRSAKAIAEQQTRFEAEQLELDAKEVKSLGKINLMYTRQLRILQKQAPNQNNKNEIEALKRSHSLKIKSLISSEKYQEYLALKKEKEEKEAQKDN